MPTSLRFYPAILCSLAIFTMNSSFPPAAPAAEPANPAPANPAPASPKYEVREDPRGPLVFRDDQLVTQYLTMSGHKPVLYPLHGPDGVPLTRAFPIADALPGEAKDHVHHRSLWFTHGEVNEFDFWAEGEHCGKIKQTSSKATADSEQAKLETENDWLTPAGDVLLSDQRTLVFHDVEGAQVIDFDIVLTAGKEDVVFGDTKEGSFGVRVAGTMKVDAKQGGTILTNRGAKDGAAWGQEAEWVDYSGPVDGKTYGVTIMNHPSSFGFPTRWHVRSYGLFAANPFGVHHFVGGKRTEGVRLPAGESLSLRYRLVLHRGAAADANLDAQWKAYAGE